MALLYKALRNTFFLFVGFFGPTIFLVISLYTLFFLGFGIFFVCYEILFQWVLKGL